MPLSAPVRRWTGFGALALGLALIVIDTTVVTVAVPSLVSELGISSAQVQWVQGGYPVVLAALLLLVGRVADVIGARRVFLTGTVVFVLASTLAAAAPDGALLVAARFVQGAAAAMIMPTSLALVNTTFSGVERGRAFAVWGATLGVSAAVGPVLGGALAEISWRWAFLINVPLGVVIFVGVAVCLSPAPRSTGAVDIGGAALSFLGFGLLAFALVEGRTYGWVMAIRPVDLGVVSWDAGPSVVLVALVVAVVALVAFGRRQRVLTRGARTEPLMDVGLFAARSFRYGVLTLLIIGIGELGIIAVLPLWMQFVLGYSSLESGLALVPLALGTFAASALSMGLIARLAPVVLVRLGLVVEIVALAAIGLVAAPTGPGWPVMAALFVLGVGHGFASAQIANVILSEVPAASAGSGAAVQATSAQVGSALGIAVTTSTFFTVLGLSMNARLAAGGTDPIMADRTTDAVTTSAGAVIPSLLTRPGTAGAADAALRAMTDGARVTAIAAAGLLVLALVATMLIPAAPAPGADTPDDAAKDTASRGHA